MIIKENLKLIEISKTSHFLPFEIEWHDLNVRKYDKINGLFLFLNLNYIEDSESIFRFHYVHEFLALALKAPRWSPFLNLSLKYRKSQKLIGFLSSNPKQIIFDRSIFCAPDVNFLCLDKRMRNRRFVSIIIQEMIRRLNLTGILQAVFTSGIRLPSSMFSSSYYHYPINRHKLITFGFIKKNLHCQKTLFKKKKFLVNLKKVIQNKYKSVRKSVLNLKIYRHYNRKDFSYWFKYIPGVMYIIDCGKKFSVENQIFTFYSLPSKCLKSRKKNFLYGIYLFYKTNKILDNELFIFSIKIIEKNGFDMINILESETIEKELLNINFIKGTGRLNFYIYNWNHSNINIENNGLIFF